MSLAGWIFILLFCVSGFLTVLNQKEQRKIQNHQRNLAYYRHIELMTQLRRLSIQNQTPSVPQEVSTKSAPLPPKAPKAKKNYDENPQRIIEI